MRKGATLELPVSMEELTKDSVKGKEVKSEELRVKAIVKKVDIRKS